MEIIWSMVEDPWWSYLIHFNTFSHKEEKEINFNNENKDELFGMLFS